MGFFHSQIMFSSFSVKVPLLGYFFFRIQDPFLRRFGFCLACFCVKPFLPGDFFSFRFCFVGIFSAAPLKCPTPSLGDFELGVFFALGSPFNGGINWFCSFRYF